MTILRSGVVLAAALLGRAMPAEAQTPEVTGAQVRVSRSGSVARLQGELIAVSPDTVWLLNDATLFGIPSKDVLQVQVKRRPIGATGILAWGVVAGVASGVGLTAACSSYEGGGGCGAVLPAVLLSWGLWSGIWGAIAGSPYSTYSPEKFQSDLRAFARFPQGLPSPLDPARLRAAPSDTGQAVRPR